MKPLQPGQVTCPYCGWDHSYRHNDGIFLPEGTILYGKYMIGKVLGKGGFGITYLAMELTLRVRVAIKEFFPNSISTRQPDSQKVKVQTGKEGWDWYLKGLDAFQNEARTLALFNSPSIVHVREFFLANNTAYIVMDYVDGVSFGTALNYCAGGRMPWKRVVTLMMPLMAELQKLHEKNLIHRDIKPDNIRIVLDPETGLERLVLLDFGAVRGFSQGTLTYSQMLTPGYAPYEQYLERTHQGPYTDVYALCGTMYKAITGQKPTAAPDRILSGNGKLEPFKSFGLNVPKKVEKAIMHGLEREAKDRPQTMGALYREFEQIPALKRLEKSSSLPPALPNAGLSRSDETAAGTGLFSDGKFFAPVKGKRFPLLLLASLLIALAGILLVPFVMKQYAVWKMHEQTRRGIEAYESENYGKALEFLLPAVDSGSPDAMLCLGLMHLEGKGVVQSDEKAANYFNMAADLGSEEGRRQLELLSNKDTAQPDEKPTELSSGPEEEASAETPTPEVTDVNNDLPSDEHIPTVTVPPGSTPEPAFPVSTPTLRIPTILPTTVSIASGRFQNQKPADGTKFAVGEKFDLTWTVENTGTTNWDSAFKLVYDGGYNFTADKITEKTTGVMIWPKGAGDLKLSCAAPDAAGTYLMQWHVEDENGATVFSPLTASIDVVESKPTAVPDTGSDESYVDFSEWDFDIVVNYDKDDTTTDIDTVRRLETWYSHLLISGGEPGKSIRISYKSKWPSGYVFTKSFQGSYTSDDTPYERQNYDGETGEVTVGFYDMTGTILLAEKTLGIDE